MQIKEPKWKERATCDDSKKPISERTTGAGGAESERSDTNERHHVKEERVQQIIGRSDRRRGTRDYSKAITEIQSMHI